MHSGDLGDESESQINVSFQSHRNNSHSRIGMGVYNVPSTHIGTPIPNSESKSFAAEMSKNK